MEEYSNCCMAEVMDKGELYWDDPRRFICSDCGDAIDEEDIVNRVYNANGDPMPETWYRIERHDGVMYDEKFSTQWQAEFVLNNRLNSGDSKVEASVKKITTHYF
jgi:hypothetical protein